GDDGVALVMVMRSPRARQARSVSVVAGNVWPKSGAAYMRRNLRLLGARLPVYVGAQRPLVQSAALLKYEGKIEYNGAFGIPSEADEKSDAIEAMARIIDSAPSPVTILGIGPMTNVAMLLRERPGLEDKIGLLILMGGNLHVPGNATRAAEFNFWFDPEAAQ